MQTERDAQIVAWIGRVGAAGAEHVQTRFGMRHTKAYKRLGALKAAGLLDHYRLLHRRPGMYAATRDALAWQGLDRLSVYQLSPAVFEHTWQVTTADVALHQALPDWQMIGEREIQAQEAQEGELIASAQIHGVGRRPGCHRPDIALMSPSGRVIAVEVELSVKSRFALEAICRGWSGAHHIDHVYYLAEHWAARAVQRTARRLNAQDRITVLALDDVTGLVERALAREANLQDEQVEQRLPSGKHQSQDLWEFPNEDAFQIDGEEAHDVLGA